MSPLAWVLREQYVRWGAEDPADASGYTAGRGCWTGGIPESAIPEHVRVATLAALAEEEPA